MPTYLAITQEGFAKALKQDHTSLHSLSEKFTQHDRQHLQGTIQSSDEILKIDTVIEKIRSLSERS